MAITSSVVVDGPNVQADGQRRGVIEFTFDDGRVVRRSVRAPDITAWTALLLAIDGEVEAAIQLSDAEEASQTDTEITAVKQASIKQVAVAYLRTAYATGDPLRAYLLFSRFNDYRNSQGWSMDQVVTNLATVGLTDEEWADMKDRYLYLSDAARVTTMQAYDGVLSGDTWGEAFR